VIFSPLTVFGKGMVNEHTESEAVGQRRPLQHFKIAVDRAWWQASSMSLFHSLTGISLD
jgi:hypothetical protein